MENQAKLANQYANVSTWQYHRGKRLIELANPQKGETVLDLGCGTGQLTYELAHRVMPSGKVIAIDPDGERLKVAKANLPTHLTNITFIESKAEQLSRIEDESINLIYSNYVIHWIPDKTLMLAEMARYLDLKGRCVIDMVGELMPFLREVSLLAGKSGKKLVDKFYCHTREEWQTLFTQYGFQVKYAALPKLDFTFENLNHFFDWWEGTSHGLFLKNNLSEVTIDKLQQRFPDRVYFTGHAYQAIAKKSVIDELNG